jgi:hypothetical protein
VALALGMKKTFLSIVDVLFMMHCFHCSYTVADEFALRHRPGPFLSGLVAGGGEAWGARRRSPTNGQTRGENISSFGIGWPTSSIIIGLH